MIIVITATALTGCLGQGVTGKWCGNAETEEFSLTVELDIHDDGTADYDITKLRKDALGLAEYFGTVNWTVNEDGRVILYETDIANPSRVLEKDGSSLKWGTLYEGIDYVLLKRT